MGVHLSSTEKKVALFCSVTGIAFGPIFDDDEEAISFVEWFESGDACEAAMRPGSKVAGIPALDGHQLDPRNYTSSDVVRLHEIWVDLRNPEPTDDQIYNRPGVEGGIGYPLGPEPMHEHDWRL
jgi:hypothetical protein